MLVALCKVVPTSDELVCMSKATRATLAQVGAGEKYGLLKAELLRFQADPGVDGPRLVAAITAARGTTPPVELQALAHASSPWPSPSASETWSPRRLCLTWS